MSDPSCSDLIALARASTGDAARAQLAAAEGVIAWPQDWIELAKAWVSIDPAEARRCLGAALDAGPHELWVARHAAEVFLRQLADAPAARAALDRCADALAEGRPHHPTRGYEWQLLGQGYQVLLGDEDAAARCLARASGPGATLDDLCAAARGQASLPGGGERARALLALAEADIHAGRLDGQRSATAACWSLAITFDAIGDLASGERLRQLGKTLAAGYDDHATMALAFRRHSRDETTAALDRALAAVTAAPEGIELAHRCQELDGGAPRIRLALDRARSLAATDTERMEVAAALRHLLHDDDAARALAPRGLFPAQSIVRRAPLKGWTIDPATFYVRLRARVTRPMLESIARADYGQDFERHLAHLVDLQSTGLLPLKLGWEPREVLSLFHHDTGLKVDHVARAFACAVLCFGAAGHETGWVNGIESTLAVLLESAREIGAMDADLIAFLAAISEGLPDQTEQLFGRFAMLLAAVTVAPADPRLPALVAEVESLEPEALGHGLSNPQHGYLFRATHFDGRHDLWKKLSREILTPAAGASPAVARLLGKLTLA